MELLLIKAFSVIALVLALTTIAEKVSTKVSGFLSGLPIGSLITLVFFAIEYGVDYVEKTALYNIHGLFAVLAFCYGYYLSTFHKGKFEVLVSLLISFISYIVIAYILSFIPPHIFLTPIIVFVLLLVSAIYFSKKQDHKIEKAQKISLVDLLLRIVLTVSIFLVITALPQHLPLNLAGIFSSFPTILLPLLLIIHFKHSNLQARTIIKNTPFGLTSVVLYSFLVYLSYPILGVFYGTLLSLILSIAFVLLLTKILKKLQIM